MYDAVPEYSSVLQVDSYVSDCHKWRSKIKQFGKSTSRKVNRLELLYNI